MGNIKWIDLEHFELIAKERGRPRISRTGRPAVCQPCFFFFLGWKISTQSLGQGHITVHLQIRINLYPNALDSLSTYSIPFGITNYGN